VTFLIGWSVVFALWLTFGLPIGPDSPLIYPAAKSQLGG
jgi:p-aminobenzoyl-glutamate transporter AbgT